MSSAARPDISVVLPTYNRAGRLSRLLGDLERQTLAPTAFEVVVWVDGSTDETGEVVDAWRERAAFALRVHEGPNRGQATARHEAILRAAGPRVLMVDDDMELAPVLLEAHLRAAVGDPGRAIVVGRIHPAAGWRRRPLHEVVREHSLDDGHRPRRGSGAGLDASAMLGGNVSVPRALYLAVGGFDLSLRLDEDRDLALRLERAGGVFVRAGDAWTVHHSDVGGYGQWEARQREYGRAAVRIWAKHGRDPFAHPLRNFVNGSRANRLAVRLLARDDRSARAGAFVLRSAGEALFRLGLLTPAIATHKAIQAVQYHVGVRQELGSWRGLRAAAAAFRADPDRPEGPTGQGTCRRHPPGPLGLPATPDAGAASANGDSPRPTPGPARDDVR